MTTRLLILGNGQIGTELFHLVPNHWYVKVITRKEVDFALDQNLLYRLIINFDPQFVVNTVAYTNVNQAESEIDIAFTINAKAPGVIAKACSKVGALMIHFSTDYVFDGNKIGFYVEGDQINPINIYGKSKAAGEFMVRDNSSKYVILRTSWVYSIYRNNFVKTMIKLAIANSEAVIKVVDDQYGSPTYAKDLANVVVNIINKYPIIKDNALGIFHCCNQGDSSWFGLAREIFLQIEKKGKKTPMLQAIPSKDYKTVALRPLNSRLSCLRLMDVYNEQLRSWTDALSDMLMKYKY